MIHDGMQGFDDTLTQLFMKKIKIMMVIYQVRGSSAFCVSVPWKTSMKYEQLGRKMRAFVCPMIGLVWYYILFQF
jgi:hypothetical protein